MPKRICPFEEDLQPQLKLHVGQKQVDKGVSSDERMKDVYDKTLNLLKAGAKIFSCRLNKSAQMDPTDLPLPQTCKLKSMSNLKQMLLTNKLQLTASDKVINDVQVYMCDCGQVINQSVVNRCYYCDQVLCFSCLSSCAGCTELFCQDCSIPVYNCDEQNICLNCYQ